MIRSLMYLNASRPDIMFVVCSCARYQVTPNECHFHAVKRIFRYLKGRSKLGHWYLKESPFDLVAYSDSDYGGANQDRKSTTKGCQFLGRRLISWQCKKRTIMATFTTEAKYVVAVGDSGNSGNGLNRDPVVNMCLNILHGSDSEQWTHEFMHIYLVFETVYVWIGFGPLQGSKQRMKKKNIAKVNGRQRTVSESSIRRHLKLNVQEASGGLRSVFTTASLSVATASTVVSPAVTTAIGSFPTALIFTIASVATPTTRVTRSSRGVVIESSSPRYVNIPSISKKDKGKRKMTEPEQLSKEKVLEQMSAQLARDLEAKFTQEDQIIREQAGRDSEIARIHAKKELEMMIAELDRSHEIVAKYLSEYEQAIARLSRYEKLGRESFKKLKTAEVLGTEPSQEQQSEEPKELFKEELKKMMKLVPVEELYIEALQVKYPIIDWEIYFEGQRKYWKIIRIRNHTKAYQIFDDMLKKFDREDLDRLWSLVKETCNTRVVTDEKEKELWVELKRLYEHDSRDPLWALQRYMHDPLV
nr:putative ribonuclease H-like domain-containing protein [Tanacetum cinerariifolium]